MKIDCIHVMVDFRWYWVQLWYNKGQQGSNKLQFVRFVLSIHFTEQFQRWKCTSSTKTIQPLRKLEHRQWQIGLQQAAARCHKHVVGVCNYSQLQRQSFRRACLNSPMYLLKWKTIQRSKYHLERREWFPDPELIKIILAPSLLSLRLEGRAPCWHASFCFGVAAAHDSPTSIKPSGTSLHA